MVMNVNPEIHMCKKCAFIFLYLSWFYIWSSNSHKAIWSLHKLFPQSMSMSPYSDKATDGLWDSSFFHPNFCYSVDGRMFMWLLAQMGIHKTSAFTIHMPFLGTQETFFISPHWGTWELCQVHWTAQLRHSLCYAQEPKMAWQILLTLGISLDHISLTSFSTSSWRYFSPFKGCVISLDPPG